VTDSLVTRTTAQGSVRLDLRVVPRASRTAIEGVRQGRLVVRVTAPPVDDAANAAVIEALAAALRLPRRSVRLVAGATARNKTVDVTGLTETDLRARLSL
jgi:uncharacterized protein (TIGR00251 family)